MKTKTKLIACLILGISACAPAPKGSIESSGPANEAVTAELVAQAEALTAEGEDLMSIKTLPEAYGKFSEALKLDPGNPAANLWARFAAVILEFKGYAKRVQPLYVKSPNGLERYQKMTGNLSDIPALSDFFWDGPEDIDSELKMREHMHRLYLRLDEFRHVARKFSDRHFTIRAPRDTAWLIGALEHDSECNPVLRVLENQMSGCQLSKMVTVKIDRLDLESVAFHAGLYMSIVGLYYAYEFDSLLLHALGERMSVKDLVKAIAQSQSGNILRRAYLERNQETLGEWVAGLKYVSAHQAEACAVDSRGEEVRKENLTRHTLCFKEEKKVHFDNTLQVAELIFKGVAVSINRTGLTVPLKVKPHMLWTQVDSNAKKYLPLRYSKSGALVTLVDDGPYSKFFEGGAANDLIKAYNQADFNFTHGLDSDSEQNEEVR